MSGKLDADDPAAGVETSGVSITGQVSISTPVFAVNVEGTNGDMSLDVNGLAVPSLIPPSIVSRYIGPSTIYVNKTRRMRQLRRDTFPIAESGNQLA